MTEREAILALERNPEFDRGVSIELEEIMHDEQARAAIIAVEGRRRQVRASRGYGRPGRTNDEL